MTNECAVAFAQTINTGIKYFILIQHILQNFDMSQLNANIFANRSLNLGMGMQGLLCADTCSYLLLGTNMNTCHKKP